MSHGEGGWEKFTQPFVEQFDNKCNHWQKMKRLEFNEGFKQLARGNLSLFCLRLRLRRGRNKRTQINECIGKKCRQLFVSLTKVNWY